ncbi:hypothetical protein PGTUg99_035406 [Puccinia graminis f. sp. tritici]|uniref:Hydrophobin n=1 Tax=Puccinia graminis f. sp. tritici TaxID=56615 RepID=A0A5B0SLG2_PUCGR|nr:hypothetical protein PGTUg99_035406 [Puccinia graminis f. sp. tritici]
MHVIKSIFILLTLKFALVCACDETKFRHACGQNTLGGVAKARLHAVEGACGRGMTSLCCDKTQLGKGGIKTGAAAAAVPCHPQPK